MTSKERIEKWVNTVRTKYPDSAGLVQHFLNVHAPHQPTDTPVTVPRYVFDCMAMFTLIGLETVEPSEDE